MNQIERLKRVLDVMDAAKIPYPPRWRDITDPDWAERVIVICKLTFNAEY